LGGGWGRILLASDPYRIYNTIHTLNLIGKQFGIATLQTRGNGSVQVHDSVDCLDIKQTRSLQLGMPRETRLDIGRDLFVGGGIRGLREDSAPR
jgi:hypothetical protein